MLIILALALTQSVSKADLLECANYTDKVEQAACVAEFEAAAKWLDAIGPGLFNAVLRSQLRATYLYS